MHEDSFKLGIVFAIAFVIIFILVRVIIKKEPEKKHYDEMQLQYRNKAYKIGFFSTWCLLFLAMVVEGLFGEFIKSYISQQMIYLIVVFVGFSIFAVYSIINDAFFRVNEKKRNYILLCSTALFVSVSGLVSCIKEKRFLMDGKMGMTNGGVQLVILCAFSVILISIIIKSTKERKAKA